MHDVREVVVKKDDTQTTTTTVVLADTESQTLVTSEPRTERVSSADMTGVEGRLGSKLDGVPEARRADVAARLALIEAEALQAIAGDAAAPEADQGTPMPDAERTRRIVEALKARREP